MAELPGLPAGGPATPGGVAAFLRLGPTASEDELARVDEVTTAVNALVRQWPVAAKALEVTPATWPAYVTEGATMLAGRLFRRRESPAGVAAFGELGPVYVMRNDPDVAMLLRLGSWAPPAVG